MTVNTVKLARKLMTFDRNRTNLAVLHVYYKERIGTHYSTGIRYGMEDFICN